VKLNNKNRFPFYKQLDLMDCGTTCLKMICKYYGKIVSREQINEKAFLGKDGSTLGGLSEASETLGFQSLALNCNFETLKENIPFPCIVYWRQKHFVVVYDISKTKGKTFITFADPSHGIIKYAQDDFIQAWLHKKVYSLDNDEGIVLVLEPLPIFYQNSFESDTIKKKGFVFLIQYFKPYKSLFVQLFLGLLIGSLLQLAFPFLTQAIVDFGVTNQNISFIYVILLAQLMLFVSQISVDAIRSWILMHITSRIGIKLVSSFLQKLMRLPIAFFDSKNIGDLLQRIQDHNRIQNFISTTSLNTLFSLFNIFIFGGVLFYYSTSILLVFLLGSSMYVGWTILFLKKRAEIDYKRFDQASGNQSSTIQIINGMQEIKLNGSERRRRWEWEAIQVRLFKISVSSLSISQIQNIGGTFLNELKNIIISFMSAKMVIEGQMTLGMMLSVQYIIGQLNLPIGNLISFIQLGQDASLSLERISEIHNKSEEEAFENSYTINLPTQKSINISNLSFQYGASSSPFVLNNITCTIPEGKITAIVGASGSGKTTLMKILLKFYEPTNGKISIGDTAFQSISPTVWRANCATVLQEGYIFSDSIARNISESDDAGIIDKNKILQAVKTANIEEFIESLPNGYNTKIGATGVNLSGGQRQRILIARAVYKNPEYILFDEATSALDANNEKVIMNNLNKFFVGKTVVIVAHRLSTVINADNIIVLNNGEIVEQGSHMHLVATKGHYYTLIKNQLELGN